MQGVTLSHILAACAAVAVIGLVITAGALHVFTQTETYSTVSLVIGVTFGGGAVTLGTLQASPTPTPPLPTPSAPISLTPTPGSTTNG